MSLKKWYFTHTFANHVRSLFVLLKPTFKANRPSVVEEDNTRFALGVKIPTENQQTCPFSLACYLMLPIEPTLKICRKVGTKASQLNLCTHVTLGKFFLQMWDHLHWVPLSFFLLFNSSLPSFQLLINYFCVWRD